MKFVGLRENFGKAVSIVSRIVARNASLPILENVLVETDNKRLKVSATNLEVGMHLWVKGKVEEEGKVCIPASLLGNIVANIREERITIQKEAMNLCVQTESFQGLIKGQDPNEFPLIPKLQAPATISLPTKKIAEALSQIHYIATISEIYPEISGVLWSFLKDGLILVATDSFRLGKREIAEKIPKEFVNTSFILPLKSTQELLAILEQQQENMFSVGVSENQILFTFDDIQIISRLLSGTYPNYQDLIPKDFLVQVVVDRQEFIEKVKLISVFAPKTNDCKIELEEKGMKLSTSAVSGSSQAKVNARISGSGVSEIIFNYRYLLDGLLHIKSSDVTLRIKNESTPVLFQGVKDEEYLYLVAPLKS